MRRKVKRADLKNLVYEQERLIIACQELIADGMLGAGVSRADLARRLKCSPAFVTQCLTHGRNLTLNTVAEFLLAIGLRLHVGSLRVPEKELVSSPAAELYFQFEAGASSGVHVEVRCKKHLPRDAKVVDSEEDRRRHKNSWHRTQKYHPAHGCSKCQPQAEEQK